MTNPLVSIVCITYNHEPYLPQALDGCLMQRTTFPIEIILAEDCSTDGTRAICEEYAKRYPDKIRYIWSETNVGAVANERRAMEAAQGKYIAFCEGDDYWTDADKLQRQVDFMESHPDYSVTFHRYRIYDEQTGQWQEDKSAFIIPAEEKEGCDITIEQSLSVWVTQYLTAVIRREQYDFAWVDKYKWYRDSHMFYHLMTKGKAYLFAFIGGVYRKTGKGVYSEQNNYATCIKNIEVYRELWERNDDERLRKPYIKAMQYFVDICGSSNKFRTSTWKIVAELYQTTRNKRTFLKNIVKILS